MQTFHTLFFPTWQKYTPVSSAAVHVPDAWLQSIEVVSWQAYLNQSTLKLIIVTFKWH